MNSRLDKWCMSIDKSALTGAADAFLSFSDCKVILYSPMWCASITERELVKVDPKYGMRLYGTFTEENDLLFGGKKKIRQAIHEAKISAEDGILGVSVNCGPALIGDDIEGICAEMIPSIPVAVADASGFNGEFDEGWSCAMISILEKANLVAKYGKERYVNLIGVSLIKEKDRKAICELIRKFPSYGINVNLIVGLSGNQFRNLQAMTDANINIVVHRRGIKVAQWLLSHLGQEYIILNENYDVTPQEINAILTKC